MLQMDPALSRGRALRSEGRSHGPHSCVPATRRKREPGARRAPEETRWRPLRLVSSTDTIDLIRRGLWLH